MAGYSPRDLVVTFGTTVLEGFAEDDGITLSRNEDLTSTTVGQDGGTSPTINPNRTGQCVMLFRQNGRANPILAGFVAEQESSGSLIIADIKVADPSGTVFVKMSGCYLSASPEWVYGVTTEGKNRSWTFFVENYKFTADAVGSNEETSALIIADIQAMLSFSS